jgi:hypothetical protein
MKERNELPFLSDSRLADIANDWHYHVETHLFSSGKIIDLTV